MLFDLSLVGQKNLEPATQDYYSLLEKSSPEILFCFTVLLLIVNKLKASLNPGKHS